MPSHRRYDWPGIFNMVSDSQKKARASRWEALAALREAVVRWHESNACGNSLTDVDGFRKEEDEGRRHARPCPLASHQGTRSVIFDHSFRKKSSNCSSSAGTAAGPRACGRPG